MLIIRVIILLIFPMLSSCAGGNSSPWRAYFFDGTQFSPASGNSPGALWLRSGHFPAAAEPASGTASADRLPPGSGAVAGICYVQTAGGKISPQRSFSPYPDEQITLKNKNAGIFVTRTGKDGYFAEHLVPGTYELFCRGARTEFRVTQGETTLVPIQGGKRMAD
jgi:hypothetical protein